MSLIHCVIQTRVSLYCYYSSAIRCFHTEADRLHVCAHSWPVLGSLLIKSKALHIAPYLYTHTNAHRERERDTLSLLIAWPQNRQHKAEYQPKETSKLLLKRRRNGGYRVLLTTFVACWRSSLVLSQHAVTADAWNEPMLCWQSNTSVLCRPVALNNHVLVL